MTRHEIANREYCYYRIEKDDSDYSTIFVKRVIDDRNSNFLTEIPINTMGVKIMKSRKDSVSTALDIITAHEMKCR